MALVRFEPWSLLARLQSDLNHKPVAGATDEATAAVDWTPAVDIVEYADRFELFVDLPGVASKEVEITVDEGVLSLTGERLRQNATDEVVSARRERRDGRFHRRFALPDTADPEKIRARGHDGVLEVTVPKTAKALPRKIEIAA
jgi:HSP20 family protein